jgi:Fe-S oxidoreductase
MTEVWFFRLLVLAALASMGAQIATRVRLVRRAKNNLAWDGLGRRLRRVLVEVVFQRTTIVAKPVPGTAHALVFWGFVAFGGYTTVEFLKELGLVDWTGTGWFHAYERALIPFALAVCAGMGLLLVRRGVTRPPALSLTGAVSRESMLIGVFITLLMVTFLLTFRLEDGPGARVNWWVHALVILAFLVIVPNSKHLHLLVSPLTVFLKADRLGTVPDLDFDREEVGFETVSHLEAKQVLDALTCVECGRCQERCPAFATGKALNPKKLILQNEEALLAGRFDQPLVDLYDPGVLWQCTTCGACEDACPVGVEHLPLIVGARRGLTSNGDAPPALGAMFNHLERRGNIWGLGADERQKFVTAAGLETFDPARHEYLVWLGCAGNFEADYQKSLRSLFDILRAKGVRFGVMARERCTGDPAKRTGNEFVYRELAGQNLGDLGAAGATRIVTSCPHCLKTLGHDYRTLGFEARVEHSSTLVERLTRDERAQAADADGVVFHDPCYLGRYADETAAPRALLTRFGAQVSEPERHGRETFCCGAGGGLLFEDKEEPGTRISQERFDQLRATGARTIVMGCPFCSIMLRGAQASSNADVQLVDLMTYVDGKMKARVPGSTTSPPGQTPVPDA